MSPNKIQSQLSALPAKTGVYLFKDDSDNIIYVGKASNLQSRVKSYFTTSANSTTKIHRLTTAVNDLEYIVTETEQEALILENNLIKKYVINVVTIAMKYKECPTATPIPPVTQIVTAIINPSNDP